MFQLPGIGQDDLPWVHRDEFVHYLELAHALGDPRAWPAFRQELLEALDAAFGLDAAATSVADDPGTSWRERGRDILERIRLDHDPALEWAPFSDALWNARRELRPDL